MTGVKDPLNPEWEPLEAARHIRDIRTVTISPEVATFLDVVTRGGERVR
jgi:hypothetical protein